MLLVRSVQAKQEQVGLIARGMDLVHLCLAWMKSKPVALAKI